MIQGKGSDPAAAERSVDRKEDLPLSDSDSSKDNLTAVNNLEIENQNLEKLLRKVLAEKTANKTDEAGTADEAGRADNASEAEMADNPQESKARPRPGRDEEEEALMSRLRSLIAKRGQVGTKSKDKIPGLQNKDRKSGMGRQGLISTTLVRVPFSKLNRF